MKIMVESGGGLLSALISAAFEQPKIEGKATTVLDELLYPHTTKDLYEGVVYRLRTIRKNKLVYNEIMPLFFPENTRSRDVRNSDFELNKIHPQLYTIFKGKFEDCIIEYITSDAMDIIKRVQKSYQQEDAEFDVSTISGDIYYGSIIKQVYEGPYDIIKKLVATYRQFVNAAKQKQWEYSGNSQSDVDAAMDDLEEQQSKTSVDLMDVMNVLTKSNAKIPYANALDALLHIDIKADMSQADIITAAYRYDGSHNH